MSYHVYEVEVTEVRRVKVRYYVEAANKAEATEKAKIGDTVYEDDGGQMIYEIGDRVVEYDPVAHDLTPIEHLRAQAHDLTEQDLDDVVHGICSQRASEINNQGKERQLAFLLETFGEGGAISALNEG